MKNQDVQYCLEAYLLQMCCCQVLASDLHFSASWGLCRNAVGLKMPRIVISSASKMFLAYIRSVMIGWWKKYCFSQSDGKENITCYWLLSEVGLTQPKSMASGIESIKLCCYQQLALSWPQKGVAVIICLRWNLGLRIDRTTKDIGCVRWRRQHRLKRHHIQMGSQGSDRIGGYLEHCFYYKKRNFMDKGVFMYSYTKNDVYAFCVVSLELLTGMRVIDFIRSMDYATLSDVQPSGSSILFLIWHYCSGLQSSLCRRQRKSEYVLRISCRGDKISPFPSIQLI
ncbi:hypothetical protein POM88_029244 [Heracleum sosnowskyi]|uniref:Uncharacterized protein n=1 Tax=Heracleum sosnowskyi TaxID=360622 RepID=A0AAD8MH30_9APIA|nr:hypothetical protein POM88_029244 [Heracleum sosnowskyi]